MRKTQFLYERQEEREREGKKDREREKTAALLLQMGGLSVCSICRSAKHFAGVECQNLATGVEKFFARSALWVNKPLVMPGKVFARRGRSCWWVNEIVPSFPLSCPRSTHRAETVSLRKRQIVYRWTADWLITVTARTLQTHAPCSLPDIVHRLEAGTGK